MGGTSKGAPGGSGQLAFTQALTISVPLFPAIVTDSILAAIPGAPGSTVEKNELAEAFPRTIRLLIGSRRAIISGSAPAVNQSATDCVIFFWLTVVVSWRAACAASPDPSGVNFSINCFISEAGSVGMAASLTWLFPSQRIQSAHSLSS